MDLATDEITQIEGAFEKPFCIAVARDGKKAYVTNFGAHFITEVDLVSRKSVKIGGFSSPYHLTFSEDQKKIYVTNYKSNEFSVFDLATRKVSAIRHPLLDGSGSLAIVDDKAYVVCPARDSIVVISLNPLKVLSEFLNIHAPQRIVAKGKKLYVTQYYDDSVVVINLETRKQHWISHEGVKGPFGIALFPSGVSFDLNGEPD